jgi:hypothetical protein
MESERRISFDESRVAKRTEAPQLAMPMEYLSAVPEPTSWGCVTIASAAPPVVPRSDESTM